MHATSLGGVESTLERRRRWKAEAATIPDGLVRLSVGIEDVEDLWDDLGSQALCRRVVRGSSRRAVLSDRSTTRRLGAQSVSALVSRAMKRVHHLGAVIRPSTTASTCSAIGASTPVLLGERRRSDSHDFAPSATWRVEA